MTEHETDVIRLVIQTLSGPRDRLSRLTNDWRTAAVSESMRSLLKTYRAPNGGLDSVDQCRMVLQGLIGDPIPSLHS